MLPSPSPATSPIDVAWAQFVEAATDLAAANTRFEQAEAALRTAIGAALLAGDPTHMDATLRAMLRSLDGTEA